MKIETLLKTYKEDVMKKLLVLALVLSISSMASATLVSINADGLDGSIAVMPGAVMTINAVGDAASGLDYLDMAKGFATLSLPIATPAAGDMSGVNDYSTEVLYDFELIAAAGPVSTPVAAGTQFTSTLTVTGNVGDTFDVLLIEGSSGIYGTVQTISFTIIPEPMTMGLLGLGGLFLRRRSK
jgi:hypothetical protein